MPGRAIVTILLIWGALALAAAGMFFGLIYFSGMKSTLADRFGDAGKVLSIILTIFVVPLFNLGRFLARRRRAGDRPS
jgi:hypothetical protein